MYNPNVCTYVDGSRKAYYREFKRVVELSDVVLEVLDARDPLGCRCPQVCSAVPPCCAVWWWSELAMCLLTSTTGIYT